MSTATPTPSLNPVVAEQHRIERQLAVLKDGESAVINGTLCTMVSPQVAELLQRHEWASARCRRLSAAGDYDQWLCVADEMAMCRCQLAKAGRLDLIGAA